jgi:hypothetical protein
MNSNVTTAASGGVTGALVVLALFVLKHFNIEVPPEVSASALVVIHAALVHPVMNKHITNMVAANAAKAVQDDLRAKLVDTIKVAR